MNVEPAWHPSWSRTAAPLLAFLRACPAGRTHADLREWRRATGLLSAFELVQALAWLDLRGLARTEGERDREGPKAKSGRSRAHLVRWFG